MGGWHARTGLPWPVPRSGAVPRCTSKPDPQASQAPTSVTGRTAKEGEERLHGGIDFRPLCFPGGLPLDDNFPAEREIISVVNVDTTGRSTAPWRRWD